MTEDAKNPPKIYAPTNKEYTDIIKSEVEVDEKYIQDDGVPAKIVYYCRECKSPVKPERIGKKLSFKCSNCGHQVSFGTEASVESYYNVKQKQS